MTSPIMREDLHSTIEESLRRHFAERTVAAEGYGEEFALLWRLASDHALGGKLIRPRLLVELFRALAASTEPSFLPDERTVIDLAAAIELLHYAFLLHDDVIDGDLVRRSRPNLIGALRAGDARERFPRSRADSSLHWARTGAILMGDLLLTSTLVTFARSRVHEVPRRRLLDLLEHTVMETVAGEHTDVGLSEAVITPDLRTILAMTAHKTATYSFELPLRAAAILAGAAPEVEAALSAVGRHLGLAYQLQDDLLCVFGEASAHGKEHFSDLREGKETAVIAYARMTSAWPSIEPGFGRTDLEPETAAHIRDLLRDCGAERFAQNLVDEQLAATYTVMAEAEEQSRIPLDAQRVVLSVASRIEGRRS